MLHLDFGPACRTNVGSARQKHALGHIVQLVWLLACDLFCIKRDTLPACPTHKMCDQCLVARNENILVTSYIGVVRLAKNPTNTTVHHHKQVIDAPRDLAPKQTVHHHNLASDAPRVNQEQLAMHRWFVI
jgi:hypothetical protein